MLSIFVVVVVVVNTIHVMIKSRALDLGYQIGILILPVTNHMALGK